MTDQTTRDDDDEALAAEYVVGLLPGPERSAVENRLRRDRGFAARVAAWEEYFAGLNADYGTLQPSRQVKAAIDGRLFPRARRNGAWWRAAGLVSAVLAVAVMIGSFTLFDSGKRLIAQLESSESNYRFAVEVEAGGGSVDIALASGAVVEDRTFELWLIPPDGVPRSLGTFTQAGRLQASGALQMQDGSVLAVSLEPVGGSPTGAPTGPVLALGTLSDV
ncbi:anti-sigma factor domain-containing protein [Tateyamaria armeniaca]|uniref:Anti-sigma factor domain-containing protein n=1 Tax=Tateyamaria armeniaca TaxID=2518930 RepID=A0ABW8USP4_9RHOB